MRTNFVELDDASRVAVVNPGVADTFDSVGQRVCEHLKHVSLVSQIAIAKII